MDNVQEHVVYGFLKAQINKPAFVLPGLTSHATAIRFHPHLFKRRHEKGLLDLPYTMLFAIATSQTVTVYSTDKQVPICVIKNVHLDTINDLAWATEVSKAVLIAASSDGFCSFCDVDLTALGFELADEVPEELKEFYQQRSKVNFESNIEAVRAEIAAKGANGFQKVAFRSKNKPKVESPPTVEEKTDDVEM